MAQIVMAGLVPAIHGLTRRAKNVMPGTSLGMTNRRTIYLNENKPPRLLCMGLFFTFLIGRPLGTGQASIRVRPSPLKRCSFARTAATRILAPMAGASVPGTRTMTSPGGSSPGVAATRCSSWARVP